MPLGADIPTTTNFHGHTVRSITMRPTPTSTAFRQDELSSPDPLASSFNDENNTTDVTHGSLRSLSRKQPAAVTRNQGRNSRAASLEHIPIPSSPFRTVSEQNLSPWKIRVTVEAEPEAMDSEERLTRTMTRTMKVPLRQDSSPLGATSSARGRKSQSSPSKTKRSSTPVRRQRGNSRTRRASVTDLDARPLGDDAESDDWTKQKKKTSPRKRRSSRTTKNTAATDAGHCTDSSPAKGSKKGRSTAEFEVRQDSDAALHLHDQDDKLEGPLSDNGSPELRQIDLNRVSVRQRAMSIKSAMEEHQDINNSGLLGKSYRSSTDKNIEIRKVSVNSAISYPTPSPTSSYHGGSDDIGVVDDGEDIPEAGHVGFDTVLESEGFTMIDLDTLPSARQYLSPIEDAAEPNDRPTERTMLSPQPSSSAGETRSVSDGNAEQASKPPPTIEYPVLNVDETELSSTVPSSPPVSEKEKSLLRIPTSNLRKVTPVTLSSPKLPSPPKQVFRRTPQHQHRGSAGAVFAGIALQDVVSPDHSSEQSSTRGKAPMSRSLEDDEIFGGFDAGTKRELRAGLRFGEELAKQQSSSPPVHTEAKNAFVEPLSTKVGLPVFEKQASQAVTRRQPQTQIWRGETTVQRTPIQMSNPTLSKQTTSDGSFVQTPQNPVSRKHEQTLMDTQARREREWQLEREAISRQIQNASESQVIVIDSDDDESQAPVNVPADIEMTDDIDEPFEPVSEPIPSMLDDDDEEDIWLAEARNSSSPHTHQQQSIQPTKVELIANPKQQKEPEIAREVVNRPRRSLIPSPWKRGDDVHPPEERSILLSTNLDDNTGISFWDHQQAGLTKIGTRDAQRNQLRPRRGSGKFDIDLMLSSPRKQQDQDSRLDLTGTRFAKTIEDGSTSEEIDERPTVDDRITSTTQEEEQLQDNNNNTTIGEPDAISSPEPTLRIPVNFNDSSIESPTLPQMQDGHRHGSARLQSPFKDTSTKSDSSPPRPQTPRSAMKGSRQNFGQDMRFARAETPTLGRKVIFSERSRGVDVHGLESSFSMKSGSDDSVAEQLREELGRDLLAYEDESVAESEQEGTSELEADQQPVPEAIDVESHTGPEHSDTKPGWRSWVWGKSKSSAEPKSVEQSDTTSAPTLKTSIKPQPVISTKEDPANHPAWAQTVSSIPSTSLHSSKPTKSPSTSNSIKLPSYLLPPSYPSDPTRSTTTPLATTGTFTNTHFRTLHIIYRKSLRPKFHAPKHIRPSVRRLLGTQMEIDETEQGIERGVMTWTLGEGECEVIERFMQEVELDYGVFPASASESGLGETRAENGKQNEVLWGWNVEQLAHWLCRIVVGEVVREEEAKAKAKAKATKEKKSRGT